MINVVECVNSGKLIIENENRDDLAERVNLLLNPIIRPTSRTIKTESGYTIIIPPQNIGGPKIEIEKLGGGYYMVLKTPVYYGAQTEKIIMTEKELVKEFNGFRLKKDELKADLKKMQEARNPYNYFRTKSGYVIKLLNGNNMTGASTEVKEQADGTYLVISYAYPGCVSKRELLTERELIAKFNAEKSDTQDKMYNLVA